MDTYIRTHIFIQYHIPSGLHAFWYTFLDQNNAEDTSDQFSGLCGLSIVHKEVPRRVPMSY